MRIHWLPIAFITVSSLACSESSAGGGAVDVVDVAALDVPPNGVDASDAPGELRADTVGDLQPKDTWIPDVYVTGGPPPSFYVDVLDVTDDFPRCEESTYVDCACSDGGRGYQICTREGVWTNCTCEGSVAPATGLPPRLIAPLSNLRVTSQRPTLRWELPPGLTHARVELCDDRACTMRFAQADVVGSSWRPPTALRPGVAFWHVMGLRDDGSTAWTSATWEFGVRHRDTPIDTAWGSLKDFDGDGYDDLLVRVFPDTGADAGVRFSSTSGYLLYRGRPDGLELVSASRITGRADEPYVPCERLYAIGTSDLNGDGLADAALGCYSGIELYFGTRTGGVLRPAGHLQLGFDFSLVDMDGDGDDDLFNSGPEEHRVVAYRNDSGTFDLSRSTSRFARQVHASSPATSGDIDGDGYGDGVSNYDAMEVFYGSPSIDLSRTSFSRTSAYAQHGQGPMFSADLNADGRMDLLAGAIIEHHAFNGQLIWLRTDYQDVPGCLYREVSALSRPGDLDGDGWVEFGTSTVCIDAEPIPFRGSVLRLLHTVSVGLSLSPTWTQRAEVAAIASIPGDINGDGFDDMVIARGASPTARAAVTDLQVMFGSERGPVPGPVYHLPLTLRVVIQTDHPMF